mgnify:CR=1 FL=1
MPDGELESGEWYEGMAQWIGNNWVVDVATVKVSPLYYDNDGVSTYTTCGTCLDIFEEHDTVIVNREVYCISCCSQHAIDEYEVDLNHRHRMN